MVTFTQAIITCLKDKILTLKGRASRSEFWWFMLFNFFALIALNILRIIPIFGLLLYIAGTSLLFIAQITVTARRLHDCNKKAWLLILPYALSNIPLILGLPALMLYPDLAPVIILCGTLGLILLIVLLAFLVLPGTKGPNRFDEDPL